MNKLIHRAYFISIAIILVIILTFQGSVRNELHRHGIKDMLRFVSYSNNITIAQSMKYHSTFDVFYSPVQWMNISLPGDRVRSVDQEVRTICRELLL